MRTHVDDTGQPCSHHAAPSDDTILRLALIGSRSAGFHHDIASKLQGLMMSLDEITEIGDGLDPQLQRAAESAHTSLKDVLTLLDTSRALTKPPTPTRTTIADLFARAAERYYVTLQGTIPDTAVSVAVAAMIQGLALLLDVAAGPGRGRTLVIDASITDGTVSVQIATIGEAPTGASEALALAAFALAQNGGELRCADGGKTFVVRLPIAT